jgi:hypothetical protein
MLATWAKRNQIDLWVTKVQLAEPNTVREVGGAQFIIVYGRRRTAKTTLVIRWVEMAEAVAGGQEGLRRNPIGALYINVTSALHHNQEALQKLIFMAG